MVLKFWGKVKTGQATLGERVNLLRSFLVRGVPQGRKIINQEVEETPVAEATSETRESVEAPEPKPDYDLHILVPAEMRPILRDSAKLAHKMGDIPKPELVDLMNLFIV